MIESRCAGCRKLLFKYGSTSRATIETKCPRCPNLGRTILTPSTQAA